MQLNERHPRKDNGNGYFDEEIQACKEALEPTVAELNDEYLRDTHVEGMPKDGDCCTEGCIKCDARKILAETQEPFDVVQDSKGNLVPLYTTPPPSREWVGLSDEEIDIIDEATWDEDHKVWGIHDFARAIEAKLRDKNTWLI